MNRRANGAAISTIRKALGIRQGALAASAGISAPYMSQIESGERQPPIETVADIARQLGCSVEAISYPVPDEATV